MNTLRYATVCVMTRMEFYERSGHGDWFDLRNYGSSLHFFEACHNFFEYEGDPQPVILFMGFANLHECFKRRCGIAPVVFPLIREINLLTEQEQEAINLWLDTCNTDISYHEAGKIIELFNKSWKGKFDDETDFAREIVRDRLGISTADFDYRGYFKKQLARKYHYLYGHVFRK